MKKVLILFSILALGVVGLADYSPSYSFKLTYTADYSNDYPTLVPSYSIGTEFWLNASVMGSNFTGSFALKFDSLDSAELGISTGGFFFNAYRNRIFGKTGDHMGLYDFDTGEDGFIVGFGPLSLTAIGSKDLYYLAYSSKGLSLIYGRRGGGSDYLLNFDIPMGRTKMGMIGELVYTDFGKPNVERGVYMLGLVEKNRKWGVKLTYNGTEVSLPDYTDVNLDYRHVVNLWYNGDSYSVWANLNGDDWLASSEVGASMDVGDVSFSVYKKGFENIGTTPDKWGFFNTSLTYSFKLLGGNAKLSYSFGRPAHNTVGTLGEVYYAEFSRIFGNLAFFGKVQRIVGVYEVRNTAYAELKFTGFSNGELKVSVGNGDFYNVNTFKAVANVEFNAWW